MSPSPIYRKIIDVSYVKDKALFPISWLQKQDFCEYQIYLENIRGIKVKPTQAMKIGKEGHAALYQQFAEKAAPATPGEMLAESKIAKVLSREFRVLDVKHGIYGYIDEIWLTPESFIILDDKPGTRTFASNVHQVYGYCLAFKSTLENQETRPIIAALRERGTPNIFWQAPFDQSAEADITVIIDHIHALLAGTSQFKPSDNPRKCKSCRLNIHCEHALS